jgi:glucokinase
MFSATGKCADGNCTGADDSDSKQKGRITMSYLVGIDVGGTNIVAGLVDSHGKLVSKTKRPTKAHFGFDHVLTQITQMVTEFGEQIPSDEILAVGVGIPGLVDPIRGVSTFAANLGWKDEKVAETLQNRVHVPVFVDNDVRMYVYGEAVLGAGRPYASVLGITLGTGLAAAVVDKGRIYYGAQFMAGELGHIRMEGENWLCNCGMRGCLETVASATGIARQAREALLQGRSSILREWFPESDFKCLTAEDVSKAYDAGDELAIEVMKHTGRLLGKGLSYAVTLLNPDVIVIGGGAALAGERLFAWMRDELKRFLHPAFWERLVIKTAEFIDDAGVLGSAMAARRRFLSELPGLMEVEE